MVVDGFMVMIMELERVDLRHSLELGNLLDMEEPGKCDILWVTGSSN